MTPGHCPLCGAASSTLAELIAVHARAAIRSEARRVLRSMVAAPDAAAVTLGEAQRLTCRCRSAILRGLRHGAIRGTYKGDPSSGRWAIDRRSLLAWQARRPPWQPAP